jgi:hypothetical protein
LEAINNLPQKENIKIFFEYEVNGLKQGVWGAFCANFCGFEKGGILPPLTCVRTSW